jgi:hypothetical protein
MRVLVVGPGGCATTCIIRHLTANGVICNAPDNSDLLKHLPAPDPNILTGWDRCIYVYGNLVLAVTSLFRRGYAPTQVQRLGNPHQLSSKLVDSFDAYVREVEREGKDLLGIEAQAEAWTYSSIPTLFRDTSQVGTPEFDKILNDFVGVELQPINRMQRVSRPPESLKFIAVYEHLQNVITAYGSRGCVSALY